MDRGRVSKPWLLWEYKEHSATDLQGVCVGVTNIDNFKSTNKNTSSLLTTNYKHRTSTDQAS